jgi:hypothetical protein
MHLSVDTPLTTHGIFMQFCAKFTVAISVFAPYARQIVQHGSAVKTQVWFLTYRQMASSIC